MLSPAPSLVQLVVVPVSSPVVSPIPRPPTTSLLSAVPLFFDSAPQGSSLPPPSPPVTPRAVSPITPAPSPTLSPSPESSPSPEPLCSVLDLPVARISTATFTERAPAPYRFSAGGQDYVFRVHLAATNGLYYQSFRLGDGWETTRVWPPSFSRLQLPSGSWVIFF